MIVIEGQRTKLSKVVCACHQQIPKWLHSLCIYQNTHYDKHTHKIHSVPFSLLLLLRQAHVRRTKELCCCCFCCFCYCCDWWWYSWYFSSLYTLSVWVWVWAHFLFTADVDFFPYKMNVFFFSCVTLSRDIFVSNDSHIHAVYTSHCLILYPTVAGALWF